MKNQKVKIVYEPEDDVLNIWLSKKPYDYAEDDDLVITHYTKEHQPVYVEVLFASRFWKKKAVLKIKESLKKDISASSPVAIPHRIK